MSGLSREELTALVSELADRTAPRTEADVQSGIRSLLLYGGLNLEDPQVKLETPAPGRRRVDVENGQTVLECKKDLTVGNVRSEAVKQLSGYIRDRTQELGHRYSGILTDGQEWNLYHLNQSSDEVTPVATLHVKPTDPDVEGLLVWLEGVLSTGEQLVPSPVEIRRRLGSEASGFELDVAELRDTYAQCHDNATVRQKRELWARLLAAAFGRNFQDDDELFIVHTYLVLTAEMIAHAVIGFDLRSGSISATNLVTGEEFRKAAISGVIEADFFDWPLETEQGVSFINGLARRLSRFDWKDVEHDVLKTLYESVIDPETRHRLGEYYTPDWLAERMVREVIDSPLEQRVLDPACGSGTFLFWAIRHYLESAEASGMSSKSAIDGVVSHVFGIDLHPVAVTLARVTYLLAIGRDRLRDRNPMTVPVYLGDSVQFNQSTSVLSTAGITIYTSDGLEFFARELNFPESLVSDGARFDALVDVLAGKAAVRGAGGKPPSIKQTLTTYGVTEEGDRSMVEETYKVLCHLHDFNRDHIWGDYVRNLARPVEFSRPEHRVDRLIGNPPWLRYNAMPARTQEDFRRLTKERGLQVPSSVVTSQDLAGLFVARAIELYLGRGGRFGFVMPAATLSRQQYEGFRGANFSSVLADVHVAFEMPWELTNVRPQPFPVPASVVFGTRGDAKDVSPMPRLTRWWLANVPHHHRSWSQVEELFTFNDREVVIASTEFASPYGGLVRQGSNLVPRLLLAVVERDAGPLGVPAGQIAVESDRRGPEKPPWKHLPSLEGSVEEQFVMPILIGSSILPFALRAGSKAVIPWDGSALLSASEDRIDSYPGLAHWWRLAEGVWAKNKGENTKMDLLGQIDYQGKLTIQFPLKEHRVAYTGRGERVTAARISDPLAVVDHSLYWIEVSSQEEALYLVGVINSEAIHSRIREGLSKGLFGGRNIHRTPFLVPWPQFVETVESHRLIAAAAQEAEQLVSGLTPSAGGTGAERNQIRDALKKSGIGSRLEELVEDLL